MLFSALFNEVNIHRDIHFNSLCREAQVFNQFQTFRGFRFLSSTCFRIRDFILPLRFYVSHILNWFLEILQLQRMKPNWIELLIIIEFHDDCRNLPLEWLLGKRVYEVVTQ